MSEVKTDKCDFCGILKIKDTNNWMAGSEFQDTFTLASSKQKLIAIEGSKHTIVDLCGQACALKWSQQQIERIGKLAHIPVGTPYKEAKEQLVTVDRSLGYPVDRAL